MAQTDTDGWDGILQDGERIVWQGRPDTAVALSVRSMGMAVIGFIFAGFSIFWMAGAAAAGEPYWWLGFVHFFVGDGIILYALFWSSFVRARSWYTLTNQRAFIATDLPLRGRRLDDYPIEPDMPLGWGDGTLGTVWFGFDKHQARVGRRARQIGFERIADAKEVYAMMQGFKAETEQSGPGA